MEMMVCLEQCLLKIFQHNLQAVFELSIFSNENVVITEGSFYVGWMESEQTPPIGVDSDNSAENSFIDLGLGVGFEPFEIIFEGAMMIRAEVDSANALSADDNLDLVYLFLLR